MADFSQGSIFFNLLSYEDELLLQIGTDIEDFKCSWLVVHALERADENQKKILFVSNFNLVHLQNKIRQCLNRSCLVNRKIMGSLIQGVLLR
jgi:geranylgeranyl pyrophosphate synthase